MCIRGQLGNKFSAKLILQKWSKYHEMKNCHFSIQFLYSIKFVNKQKFSWSKLGTVPSKIFSHFAKISIFNWETAWIANKAKFELIKSTFGTVPSMIMDWVLFWAILFIWLNSIDWVFVLVNWNVHIVGVFSISRTAQGSTNAPRPRLAHIYFSVGWINLFVEPWICQTFVSRRSAEEVIGWLMFLSNSSLLEHVSKSLFHLNLNSHELFLLYFWSKIGGKC